MQETCDGFTNEEIKNDCIAYNNSIIGYYFTESININQKLKTIPKKLIVYIFSLMEFRKRLILIICEVLH